MRALRNLARSAFGAHGLWIPLACAFLVVSLSRIDNGGPSAMARFATLRAMSDEHTFRIDRYHDWTFDWARTPDGHYYSNKAPGPTLIAFPVFWVIDQALYSLQDRNRDQQGRRQAPRGVHVVAISTLFQVLPFLVFTLLALQAAYPEGLPPAAYLLGTLAILFGNTAAVLMSAYVGNPFAGMAMMGAAYFFLRGKLEWMSFCFGWVVLADYTCAALVIPFAYLLWPEIRSRGFWSVGKSVAIGASLPAFLWCWYHISCFGSPLSLPFKYEVQAIEGTVDNDPAGLWGKISFLPRPRWVGELLFGSRRGVLFTQPWVLLGLACFPYAKTMRNKRLRRLFSFTAGSFLLLLWINGGFPGWHGGGTPGPRYLAAVLPLFGLFLPLLWARSSPVLRGSLVAGVAISLVLRALVYATWMLPDVAPLWPYYIKAIRSPKEWLLLALFSGILGVALYFFRRQALGSVD